MGVQCHREVERSVQIIQATVFMASEILKTIDKYHVLESLGRGAKSMIWKVQDPSSGQIYALKRVVREADEDDRFLEQVRIEYKVSSAIQHEALRRSYELKKVRSWFKTQELLLLMEYVEGPTLKDEPPKDMVSLIDVFVRVASGLDALHQNGYVHADIKPKNIILLPQNRVKIIDFGQTCPIGHRKQRIQGTPDYMAPEQVKRGVLDQRTDVFNLGASMYWVLTGQNYPTAMSKTESPTEIKLALTSTEVPAPDQVNSDCPAALSRLVMDCCHRDRAKRPYDMAEVVRRLDVAKHHLTRRQSPVSPEIASKTKRLMDDDDDHRAKNDDTAEFEKFLEDIL